MPNMSDKQANFIKVLMNERNLDLAALNLTETAFATFDVGEASKLIGKLMSTPKPIAQKAPRIEAEAITDGMYMTPDGIIYKVQYNKASGDGKRAYAKQLFVTENADATYNVRFEYAAGAVRKLTLSMRLSKEDAAAFGKLYGVCCVCGRTLTDEVSIAHGIGPICEGREWGGK